jgi:ADP-heptose:LPS heptosyltransferase
MIRPEEIRKIAFINFGGIGDEILFSPVIEEVKRYLPIYILRCFWKAVAKPFGTCCRMLMHW